MKEEPQKDAGESVASFIFYSNDILVGTLRDLLDRFYWRHDHLKVRFTLHDRTYGVQPYGWHIGYDILEFHSEKGHEDEGSLTVSELKKILNGELFSIYRYYSPGADYSLDGDIKKEVRVHDDMRIDILVYDEFDDTEGKYPCDIHSVTDDGYEIDPEKGLLYLFIR